jgi:hypothetical protein
MPYERRRADSGARRRYLFAYTLSIVLHVIAGLFFVVRSFTPILDSPAPPGEVVSSVTRDMPAVAKHVRTEANIVPVTVPRLEPKPRLPAPTAAPIPRPVPTIAPPVVRHEKPPRPTRPRVARSAPRRPELAKFTPHGTPVPERISLVAPTVTIPPTLEPSPIPTIPPTLPPAPTPLPATPRPTVAPTIAPTAAPTAAPTLVPTAVPTAVRAPAPTLAATLVPTAAPTVVPSAAPTLAPTAAPTARPSVAPTARPTSAPTARPTLAPTARPTIAPTAAPSARPTTAPTAEPTLAPTSVATRAPVVAAVPTARPSAAPTAAVPLKAAATASAGPAAATQGPVAKPGAGGGAKPSPSGAKPDPRLAKPSPTATRPTPATAVALAPQAGPSPRPNANSGALDKLNERLNAALPSADVAYSHKEYVNDIDAAVQQAQEEYFKKAAPPQGILDRALYIVRQSGTLLGPPAIVYILKRERIFGIEICTGWKIEQPSGGGDPQGGYTFGPCGGEQFTPTGGLPTLSPRTTPAPRASSS